MDMKRYIYRFGLIVFSLLGGALVSEAREDRPNFVIIFTDDQGYGDLGCFGSKTIKTPNIDKMAAEGMKFTSFMVASSLCTPSRSALLTGCYPKRIGLHKGVLFPSSKRGLNPKEYTIADHLKGLGYATACIGKWHLGDHVETLPRKHGFDYYYGIPYSNDMNHPDNKGKPKLKGDGLDVLWEDPGSTLTRWKTPLMENEEIIEMPVDQRTVTRRYTDKAIDFMTENKDKPFFLYLPHSMPHIPLYVPDDVYEGNPKNAYIHVIEYIDGEVGRVMDTIRELKLEENTYVIFASDNGPWLTFKHHGGSAGKLREGKGKTFEGGQRVPCVMWGPGRIEPRTECNELLTTMDLLPTIARLTKSELPRGHRIDGLESVSLLLDDKAIGSRDEFLYYAGKGALEGVRKGKWKLLSKTKGKKSVVMLFDLEKDVSEKYNLAMANPKIVAELTKLMLVLDSEIEKNARLEWTIK